jgi:catechol 2,3-dioxygenase-like lactoylglutathione lyase family enzyme
MVAELERATRWLVEVLSAAPLGPIVSIPGTEIRVAALLLGDFEWEIVGHPQARDGRHRVGDEGPGAHHLQLETSNLAHVGAHLSALGVALEHDGSSLRFRDPDGFAYHVALSRPADQDARVPGVFGGGVRSLGFNVRSLARSTEWYERSFGLSAVPEPGGRSALIPAGGVALRLRETAAATARPLTGMGPAHPAIAVDDVEETWTRFKREHEAVLISLRRDEHEGSRRFGRSSFFVADPDGLPVQVIGPRL